MATPGGFPRASSDKIRLNPTIRAALRRSGELNFGSG